MNQNVDDSFYLLVSTTPPDIGNVKQDKPESNAPNHEGLISNDETIAITETQVEYKSLNWHWFYTDLVLTKTVWIPMSYKDSNTLEVEYKKYM
jgi:hypothetical protein